MWGETTGHYPSATAATGEEFKTAFTGNEKGFAGDNCLFTNGGYSDKNRKVFTKYVPKDQASTCGNGGTFYDDMTTLESSDDAATANWGSAWRMPTKGEFDDLRSKTNTSTSNFSNGILTINGHPSLIFPAAGFKIPVLRPIIERWGAALFSGRWAAISPQKQAEYSSYQWNIVKRSISLPH